jgi:hypothetical protein
MISQTESENQLLRNIKNMLSEKDNNKKKNDNKNKNFIIIHFDESNMDKIGFLISFVFNNYDKNEELKFIFIVHIKRNFKVEPQSEKIFAVPDINSNIYQLFIDNLNGPDIKLDEIISNPIQKLRDKDLVNTEDEFNNALAEFTNVNLKYFKGENDIINKENYLTKLQEFFKDEKYKDLKKIIIEKIESYIDNPKEDSIGIIEKIYKSGKINRNTVDLISLIIEYDKKEIIYKYIDMILSKLEDNNILTTLLVLYNNKKLNNEEFQETVKNMIMKYIEKISIKEDTYKPKFILSFIIPCFIEFYDKI